MPRQCENHSGRGRTFKVFAHVPTKVFNELLQFKLLGYDMLKLRFPLGIVLLQYNKFLSGLLRGSFQGLLFFLQFCDRLQLAAGRLGLMIGFLPSGRQFIVPLLKGLFHGNFQ